MTSIHATAAAARTTAWTLLVAAWIAAGSATAAEWLAFRGADGRGVAATETIRRSWSETEGIAWKVELPGRSVASPIVLGDIVVATASSGPRQDRLHVIAIDRASGEVRWLRTFQATGRTLCHPTSAVAAGTPASDGERILALFSSCDLVALDRVGRLLWQRNLAVEHPSAGNDVGMGSSPRIIDDTVIVQIDCQGDAFASAIDLSSGDDRWSVSRARIASWASPLEVACGDGGACVLLQNPRGLELRRVSDGEARWRWEGDVGGIPMATTADGILYVPVNGLAALEPDGDGPRPRWQQPKLSCGIASPLAYDGTVVSLNRGGVLVFADAADGAVRKQVRLAGTFWASPILVGQTVVAINMEGTTFLVDAGGEHQIIARNELPGSFPSTPAVADGSLYLQSETAVWKTAP